MKNFEDFYNKIRLEYDEITKESTEKSIEKCEEVESMSYDEVDENRPSCLEASAIYLTVMEIFKRYHEWESENQQEQDQEPEKLSDKYIFEAYQREARKYRIRTGRTPLD